MFNKFVILLACFIGLGICIYIITELHNWVILLIMNEGIVTKKEISMFIINVLLFVFVIIPLLKMNQNTKTIWPILLAILIVVPGFRILSIIVTYWFGAGRTFFDGLHNIPLITLLQPIISKIFCFLGLILIFIFAKLVKLRMRNDIINLVKQNK